MWIIKPALSICWNIFNQFVITVTSKSQMFPRASTLFMCCGYFNISSLIYSDYLVTSSLLSISFFLFLKFLPFRESVVTLETLKSVCMLMHVCTNMLHVNTQMHAKTGEFIHKIINCLYRTSIGCYVWIQSHPEGSAVIRNELVEQVWSQVRLGQHPKFTRDSGASNEVLIHHWSPRTYMNFA